MGHRVHQPRAVRGLGGPEPDALNSLFCCPVYDQREELPALLAEFRRGLACDTLLLINNGSTDGSAELVRDSGFPYIDVPRNLGLGHACMLGLDRALASNCDVFGIIAGNGKMLPAEMPRLLDPLREDRADCVTGSRFLAGGAWPNAPAFRRSAIPAVTRLARALVGRPLTDATCGYRAFRTEPLRRATFDWHAPWLRAYGFEFYVYAKFLLEPRLRCLEVPVTMRYPTARGRYSKVPPVVGWWSMLRPWIVARVDGRGFGRTLPASGGSPAGPPARP